MKDKEQKPAEPEVTEKLPWRKPTLQKLLMFDETSAGTSTWNDGPGFS